MGFCHSQKYQITDLLQQRHRFAEANQILREDEDENNLDQLFDGKGFWQVSERPAAWSQPAQAVKSDHFWRVFEACLNGLPENLPRLFMMREFLELESPEAVRLSYGAPLSWATDHYLPRRYFKSARMDRISAIKSSNPNKTQANIIQPPPIIPLFIIVLSPV